MNLPASFIKVANSSKTAAFEDTNHATTEDEGEGNGMNKKLRKSKNGNSNLIKNLAHKTKILHWQQANSGRTHSANSSHRTGLVGKER